MKKLLFVLLVLFLLSAPAVAQAHSDGKCKKDESSCATTQDDGRRDNDHDKDKNGSNQDGGNQGNDDDDRNGHDQDKDKDKDKGKGDDDDDDRGQNGKDDKEKKDKDDRGNRPGDDGEEPGDGDDGENPGDDSDDKPNKDGCQKINDGGITTLAEDPIVMGYDIWGYNYQAHSFNGWYENVDRDGSPVSSGNIRFKMKWNDVYLSNMDCDGDGHLDRHQGHANYYGTRAWLTNTYMWSYIGDDGEVHWVHWFLKIVAQPYEGFNCASVEGTPFNSHFCVVKSDYRDPYGGSQGISALISGFGIGTK
jgi:hypothetical protein